MKSYIMFDMRGRCNGFCKVTPGIATRTYGKVLSGKTRVHVRPRGGRFIVPDLMKPTGFDFLVRVYPK